MLSCCTSCLPVALPATHPSPLHLLPRGRSSSHTSIAAELSELKRVVEELKNSESEKLEKIDVIKKERNLLLERLNEAEEKLKESEIQISSVVEAIKKSGLPSGLNCLQRNFPCYRGSPRCKQEQGVFELSR